MKQAVSARAGTFKQVIAVREHRLVADETEDKGGRDAGPDPLELLAASLASCTAITMEMYADRKGWDVGGIEVECEFQPAERGCPTKFDLIMRFPDHLDPQQVEKLRIIAAKCPVHRTLESEVMFDERVERVQLTH